MAIDRSIKREKLINDPLYGFISIPSTTVFQLIAHPWFQRLRNIKQLGLTQLVYPGAVHTRFHHALGSMHLATRVLEVLAKKGHQVTLQETEAVQIATLLHDIGHGPYSHSLERLLLLGAGHEEITLIAMSRLNNYFKGTLGSAIDVFSGTGEKTFLHQLVSGQLDMDRMDYLNRDSFYTGVTEGTINTERLLKMMDIQAGRLVLEEKAFYSIESFLMARRSMYWQVYYHKTVIAAEQMLVKITERARKVLAGGAALSGCNALIFLLSQNGTAKPSDEQFAAFMEVDDHDIWSALKSWQTHADRVLSMLCQALVARNLYAVTISDFPIDQGILSQQRRAMEEALQVTPEESSYFIFTGEILNNFYDKVEGGISMIEKNEKLNEFAIHSAIESAGVRSGKIQKYFICQYKLG